MTNQSSDEIVVEMAKTFMDLLQRDVPGWSRAFFRFEADHLKTGSNASYVAGANISLLSALRNSEFFNRMSELAWALRERMGSAEQAFCVLLLSVNSSFDFNIDFERDDPGRWRISKMGGASGLPGGIE